MSDRTVLLSRTTGVGTITLNRPEKLNAISLELMTDLADALEELAGDSGVRAVVLTGAGRGFCSGADLARPRPSAPNGAPDPELVKDVKRIVLGMRTMEKPVIVAVNGCAVGAGLSLAIGGDIIIASDRATFGAVFVRIGLIPDFAGTYLLPRLVGTAKAMELILTGKIIDAKEAAQIGLVNQVVPHEELGAAVMDLAGSLGRGPTLAHALAKRLIYESANLDLASAVELELNGIYRLKQSYDHQEGLRAFVEKRPAVFEGR